jgi:16S rRNA (guanine527-N7)-methyltransferase
MTPTMRLGSLTDEQRASLREFERLVLDLNRKINLVSRETADEFEERHILHALALTARPFPDGATVVDWGTGGGLPAIPLAIAFPAVTFVAVDAVGKKVQAVTSMARRLGLANLHAWHGRAQAWPGSAEYSVSRATAPLRDLWDWHTRVATAGDPRSADAWPPGLVCLKGGDLAGERARLLERYPALQLEVIDLQSLLDPPYFRDKVIVSVSSTSP